MNPIEQLILANILDSWHEKFGGVSALSVAQSTGISHEQVLEVFEQLEEQRKGYLRRDVTLYPISISLENPTFKVDSVGVNTTIFFPSKELLDEDFFARELHIHNIPEYKMRLHKGASRIQPVYFKSEVLRKYLDHPEFFDVENTVVGGHINHRSSYISALNSDELEKLDAIFIRFGKRKLLGGTVTITTIMYDLADLPEPEQRYWHANEIDYPKFNQDDPDFEVYWGRSVMGAFLDDNDPLTRVLNTINDINEFLDSKLFAQEKNLYLSYPAINTYKNFSDSCSELYKLIGPDSLVEKKLKELLQTHFGNSQADFKHPESGRPIAKLDLFRRLCLALELPDLPEAINEIKAHRVSADHKIIDPQLPEQDYIADFRRVTQRLADDLEVLLEKLKTLYPTATD